MKNQNTKKRFSANNYHVSIETSETSDTLGGFDKLSEAKKAAIEKRKFIIFTNEYSRFDLRDVSVRIYNNANEEVVYNRFVKKSKSLLK